MKRFVLKATAFVGGLLIVLGAALCWLPDPTARDTMLGALLDKHALLERPGTNRIIFVGGSNVSMGLDSSRVSAVTHRPVIDMAIHGGLGLRFMLHDAARYVRSGDTVIVIPEYQQFFGSQWYGDMELVAVVFDVCPESRRDVVCLQWFKLIGTMPVYATTKIRNVALAAFKTHGFDTANAKYGRNAYNEYGDIRTPPLDSPGIVRRPRRTNPASVNQEVVAELLWFREQLEKGGARLVIVPPVYQESAFDVDRIVISRIDSELKKAGIPFLASPDRYRFDNALFADTSYHLIRAGVDLRTERMIGDLSSIPL